MGAQRTGLHAPWAQPAPLAGSTWESRLGVREGPGAGGLVEKGRG